MNWNYQSLYRCPSSIVDEIVVVMEEILKESDKESDEDGDFDIEM